MRSMVCSRSAGYLGGHLDARLGGAFAGDVELHEVEQNVEPVPFQQRPLQLVELTLTPPTCATIGPCVADGGSPPPAHRRPCTHTRRSSPRCDRVQFAFQNGFSSWKRAKRAVSKGRGCLASSFSQSDRTPVQPRIMRLRPDLIRLSRLFLRLSSRPDHPPGSADQALLIISVDGLRPDVLLRADDRQHPRLIDGGSFTFWWRSTAASITLPTHVSMLTGGDPRIARHRLERRPPVAPAGLSERPHPL